MSPRLERETNLEDTFFNKFLRNGEEIIFEEPGKEHFQIAREHGFGPSVDDGGYIEPEGKFPFPDPKIKFTQTTGTCYVRGNKLEARKRTIQVAKGILGDDKVSG